MILTVNQQMNVTCSGAGRWTNISPVLPKGLSYSDGVIRGTPTEAQPVTSYTISTQNNNGVFTIGSTVLGML